MKVFIKNYLTKKIYFDTDQDLFMVDDGSDIKLRSFRELIIQLERNSKLDFTGEFYIKNYNGINKFKATKRFYSDIDDAWKVKGFEVDEYNSNQSQVYDENELFPVNPANTRCYEECSKLKREGWNLIHKGESLRGALIK